MYVSVGGGSGDGGDDEDNASDFGEVHKISGPQYEDHVSFATLHK